MGEGEQVFVISTCFEVLNGFFRFPPKGTILVGLVLTIEILSESKEIGGCYSGASLCLSRILRDHAVLRLSQSLEGTWSYCCWGAEIHSRAPAAQPRTNSTRLWK